MIYVGDAASLLKANADAGSSEDALAKKIEAANKKIERSAETVTKKVAKIGRDVAIGVAGAVAASVVLAEKMEKTTAEIAAAGGTSEAVAKKIEKAFLGTAGSAEFSAQKIGAAYATVAGELKTVEGHALTSGQALKVMEASMALAEATGGGLTKTTETLGKVMLTFGLHANQAALASNVLYNASRDTGTSIELVGQTVDRIRGKLGALSPSLGETAGLMSSLAKQGVSGRLVMSALNGAFNTLLGGGKNVKVMAKELGLELFNSNHQFVGMASVIGQLQPMLSKLNQESQLNATKALFGATANKQMLNIILQGPKAYAEATAAVQKHGAAQHAAELQAKTFEGQVRKLKAAAEDLGVKIGSKVIPVLLKMSQALASGVKWLEKHRVAAETLAAVIATVLGVALTVYAYTKAVAFIDATKNMIRGMALLAEKIGFSAAVVETSFDGIPSAAEAAAARTATVQAGLAGDIEGADATIVTANEEAGASFTAMLGPIGAVMAALTVAQPEIQKLTGGDIANTNKDDRAAHNATGVGLQAGGAKTDKIAMFLQEHAGLSSAAAAGVTKILGAESGLSTTNTGSEGAYGIAQWLGSRLDGLRKFAGQSGGSGNSLQTQMEYLVKELQGPEKGTLGQLKGAKSVHEAEEIFVSKFERPNKENYGAIYERAKGYHVDAGSTHKIGYNKAGGEVEEGVVHANYKKKNQKTQKKLNEGSGSIKTPEQISEEESAAKKLTSAHNKSVSSAQKRLEKAEQEYVNPLANAHGLVRGREDQGIDYSMKPGSKIGAIGAGRVTKILQNWYKGQPLLEYELTKGAEKGKNVYVAEQLNPSVKVGQKLKPGQTIGTYAASGTGIEMGFAAGGGRTLAQATTGYKEGQKTPAAEEFAKFLASVGHNKASGGVGSNIEIANKTFEAANKKALLVQTADKKKADEQLKTIYSAITSNSLSNLTKVVGNVHDKWLSKLEAKLNGDHTAALSALSAKLVAAHKAALRALDVTTKIVWKEGIDSLKKESTELVKQAGEAWKNITQGMIEAAHDAAIKAIEKGPLATALKSKQEEGEAEEDKATERSNTRGLAAAQKNLKEVKATGDKEKTKEAQEQVVEAEEAITRFARQQDEKRAEKKLEQEKTAVDTAEESELGSLNARQANYEAMLGNNLFALDEQLNKAEINYAQFAVKVNAILSAVGLSYGGNPEAQKKLEEIAGGVVPHESEEGRVKVGMPLKKMAAGGRVYPGIGYVVNEVGHETFIPSTAGTIVPAGASQGLGGVSMNFHGPVTMGSQRDAKRLAHTIAFRLRHG